MLFLVPAISQTHKSLENSQDFFVKTKTKTLGLKTKTLFFVLKAPRDQDFGLEDYITAITIGWQCLWCVCSWPLDNKLAHAEGGHMASWSRSHEHLLATTGRPGCQLKVFNIRTNQVTFCLWHVSTRACYANTLSLVAVVHMARHGIFLHRSWCVQ